MTQSSEHCGESRPHPAHKAMRGRVVFRCPGHEPTPPALRDRYAAAIRSIRLGDDETLLDDTNVDIATDAVLAVRDRELEQMRTELAMQKGISADLRVESRARSEKVERVRAVVRAELDYLCRKPHPSHDHVCPDDVRRSVLRALESEEPPTTPAVTPQHLGNEANAEDCGACSGTNLPYPWVCPGESS